MTDMPTTDNEIQIVEIQPHGTVQKVANPYPSWNKWTLNVRYKLADGQLVEGSRYFSTKRDGDAFLATLPRAPEHPMTAIFHDDKFWGTSTRYALSGGA